DGHRWRRDRHRLQGLTEKKGATPRRAWSSTERPRGLRSRCAAGGDQEVDRKPVGLFFLGLPSGLGAGPLPARLPIIRQAPRRRSRAREVAGERTADWTAGQLGPGSVEHAPWPGKGRLDIGGI